MKAIEKGTIDALRGRWQEYGVAVDDSLAFETHLLIEDHPIP